MKILNQKHKNQNHTKTHLLTVMTKDNVEKGIKRMIEMVLIEMALVANIGNANIATTERAMASVTHPLHLSLDNVLCHDNEMKTMWGFVRSSVFDLKNLYISL